MKKNMFLLIAAFMLYGGAISQVYAQANPDIIQLWRNGNPLFSAPIESVDSITFITEQPPQEDPDKDVNVTLSKTGVKMALTVYDSEKGDVANTDRFTISPSDGTYEITASVNDIVTWKIAKNVVTLTAMNIGKTQLTITETKSKSTATYDVEVVSILESLSFTQATVSYYNSEEYLATLDTVDSVFTWINPDNEEVALRAFLVDVDLHLFSDGFYVNDNGDYDGAAVGYIAVFPGKAWYAPKGLNSDRGFDGSASLTTGIWKTGTQTKAKVLAPGTFTNGEAAFEHVKQAIASFNDYIASDYESVSDLENFWKEMTTADTLAFKGGRLIRCTYFSDGYSFDFMPAALIPEAQMQLAWNDKSMYMYSVPAVQMTIQPINGDNGWGVKVEQNETTKEYTLLSEGFEFGQQFTYRHVPDNDNEAAPARKGTQFDRHILTTQPKNVVKRRK